MLLAIDVGNTNTTIAVFDGEELVADWRIRTVARRTEDEYGVLFDSLFARRNLKSSDIQAVAICSVAPAAAGPLAKFSLRQFGLQPFVLDGRNAGIDVKYSPTTDVGADRLANAIAAHARYSGPVVVVDFGTATTFDAVDAEGAYLGGAITPGIETAVEALVARTSQLRRVQFVAPESAIGSTTVESLQSGIVFGYAGQVDGIVERFKFEMGGEARVIATGGLAELVAPETTTIQEIDPLLTLQGLRIAYERNYKA